MLRPEKDHGRTGPIISTRRHRDRRVRGTAPAASHALYAFITKLLVNHADVEDVFQSKGNDRGLNIGSVRLRAGRNSSWLIDELRIGTTWQSVAQPRDGD